MSNSEEQDLQSLEKGQEVYSALLPLVFITLFVLLSFQYAFPTFEGVLYDLRIKFDILKPANNIVLITLDEESDQFLGDVYPYSYSNYGRLLKKLLPTNPLALGFLVDFEGPRTTLDLKQKRLMRKNLTNFSKGKDRKILFSRGFHKNERNVSKKLLFTNFPQSLAYMPTDDNIFTKDRVSRRLVLDKSGESSFGLLMANFYRSFNKQPALDVSSILGSFYNAEHDSTMALYRYSANPVENQISYPLISFYQVVTGNFPKDLFHNKIVLIGPNYITNSLDYIWSPFNSQFKAPKINVISNQIESLIKDKTVYLIPKNISYIVALILAWFLSVTFARINPIKGMIITLVVLLGTLMIGYLLFIFFGLWLYLAHILIAVLVSYYVLVPFRAVEEYKRRYAFQEETKILKKVESLKRNFISLMSHDIKTPVAKIVGQADILLRQNDGKNSEMTHGLHNIINATKELNKFISSILDLSKVESSNMRLNKVSKDINKVIDSVIDNLKFEAGNAQVAINKDLGPLFPITIDVTLMFRVISNLVENAIKYSGTGSEISVKTWDDDVWAYVEISDNGAGIEQEDLEHIFDKFYRVKNDANHAIKGSGLGLYLVKYFVELHEGKINVDSKLGEGTTFSIKLPNR